MMGADYFASGDEDFVIIVSDGYKEIARLVIPVKKLKKDMPLYFDIWGGRSR